MTTDNKTLADAQPGGRVRMGDQALSTSEGARRYVADFFATQLRRQDFGDYILTELAADFACALAQHLSAQPSPGGQGDAPFPWENFPAYLIDKCEGDTISEEGLQQALAAMAKDERYCLAARQPVGQEAIGRVLSGDGIRGIEWREGMRPLAGAMLYSAPVYAAPPAQAVDLGQLPRVIELLSNVSRTLVDWAADEQREAIGIVKALIDSQAVGNG